MILAKTNGRHGGVLAAWSALYAFPGRMQGRRRCVYWSIDERADMLALGWCWGAGMLLAAGPVRLEPVALGAHPLLNVICTSPSIPRP